MNKTLRSGLHGLVDQLPDSWTTHRRDLFIAAFLSVIDFSVHLDDDLPSTHEELPRWRVESPTPRIPFTRPTSNGEADTDPVPAAEADAGASALSVAIASILEVHPSTESTPSVPEAKLHAYEPHPDYGKVCKVCGLSEGWREHVRPVSEQPEATLDDQLVEKLEQSVENIEAKRYVCPICDRAFPTDMALRGHTVMAHSDPQACEKCNMTFGSPAALGSHNRHMHPPGETAAPAERPPDYTPLDAARQRWQSRIEPKAEPKPVRIADGPEKPFACKCGEEFDANSDLIRHLNSKESAANRKQHHIIRQPRATMVPSGIPARVDESSARRAAYSEVGPENAS